MNYINNKNVEDLIRGASLFSCGGGLSVVKQLQETKKLGIFSVELRKISELPLESYLFTAAEIGRTAAPPINKRPFLTKMLRLLKENAKLSISGIYPVELGQESIVVQTSSALKFPIIDFDPAGMRAVPFVDINIFNLKEIPVLYETLVICDGKHIEVIKGCKSAVQAEQCMRSYVAKTKNGIFFSIGELVKVKDIMNANIANQSYSKSLSFGYISSWEKLSEELHGSLVIEGKVLKINQKFQIGFSAQEITIETSKGNMYLILCNEAIFLLNAKRKIIASVPQRILLIDKDVLIGISGEQLSIGRKFMIVVLTPEKGWRGKRAQELFGKKRFSYLL